MLTNKMVWTGTILFLAGTVIGCGDDSQGGGGQGQGNGVSLTGRVTLLSGTGTDQESEPGDGVAVEAWCDRNGDGSISGDERVSTTTDEQGRFSLSVPAETGAKLVVKVQADGYAPAIRTFRLEGLGHLQTDVTLLEMSELTCHMGSCVGDGGRVSILGVPAASGYARVFNPVSETDQFPGPFSDDQGNVLESGVFAAFDLEDESGAPVTALPQGQKATIRLQVPRDTWARMRDLAPGDGVITVPMYSFDEDRGIWVREGEGEIQDASGQSLSETDLAAVRDGTYSGDIFLSAQVSHFSFWNLDWPIEDTACLQGRLLRPDGSPAAGVTIRMHGLNFTGVSDRVVTGSDGGFCFNVARSEAPGEDLDGDGVTGQVRSVVVVAHEDDRWYRFGPFDLPTTQGSCADGDCTDLGRLTLDEEHRIQIHLCHVTGTVVWPEGAPSLGGVTVSGADDSMATEAFEQFCSDHQCTNHVEPGPDGTFSLTVPHLVRLQVSAYGESSSFDGMAAYRYGADKTFLDCPTEPVTLTMELTSCSVLLPQVSYDSNSGTITWDPPIQANAVAVQDIMSSSVKWAIVPGEGQGGITPPVVYGTVPSGAQQAFPPGGQSPAPVTAGDTIMVSPFEGTMEYEGHACKAVGVGYAQ